MRIHIRTNFHACWLTVLRAIGLSLILGNIFSIDWCIRTPSYSNNSIRCTIDSTFPTRSGLSIIILSKAFFLIHLVLFLGSLAPSWLCDRQPYSLRSPHSKLSMITAGILSLLIPSSGLPATMRIITISIIRFVRHTSWLKSCSWKLWPGRRNKIQLLPTIFRSLGCHVGHANDQARYWATETKGSKVVIIGGLAICFWVFMRIIPYFNWIYNSYSFVEFHVHLPDRIWEVRVTKWTTSWQALEWIVRSPLPARTPPRLSALLI